MSEAPSHPILDEIKQKITDNKVMLFTKGTKEMPMCGFSATVIGIFNHLNVPFETMDILPDPQIRQTLSGYSNWPTIPQVFVDGKFVGGCDIVRELFEKGELQQVLESAGLQPAPNPEAGAH